MGPLFLLALLVGEPFDFQLADPSRAGLVADPASAVSTCKIRQSLAVDFRGDRKPLNVEKSFCCANGKCPDLVEWLLVVREEGRPILVEPIGEGEAIELQRIEAGERRQALLIEHDLGGQGPARPDCGVLAWTHGQLRLLEAPDLFAAAGVKRWSTGNQAWSVKASRGKLQVKMAIYTDADDALGPSGGSIEALLAPAVEQGTLRLISLRRKR